MQFIYNDGGRKDCGYRGETGDCVARSIAIATGRPYWRIYSDLAWLNLNMSKTKGRPSAGIHSASFGIYTRSVLFRRYMVDLDFVWTPIMGIGTGCRVHLRADELPSGRLVVALSKHLTAVIDGVVYDTHDPSRGGTRCVYGYWRLNEAHT